MTDVFYDNFIMIWIVTSFFKYLLSNLQYRLYDNELMETLQYDDSSVNTTPDSSASNIVAQLTKRKNLMFNTCNTFCFANKFGKLI
jgi:hypothetical protein